MEQSMKLGNETVEKIKDLVRINLDSAKGFEAVAKQLKSEPVAQMMRTMAKERDGFASELRSQIHFNDEVVTDEGTTQAALHRWWIKVRGTVQDGDLGAMLSEAEKGEDSIKHLYEDTLEETRGSAVSAMLHKQYAQVKQSHDRIRSMRDGVKGKAELEVGTKTERKY